MAIKFKREGKLYSVEVTPLDVHGPWKTSHPMPLAELQKTLLDMGVHPVDFFDALTMCVPDWRRTNPELA